MIVTPAIDLRDGQCVQLVGGSYDEERIRWPDPINVAKEWEAMGFTRLHVIDLDAATGRGGNTELIESMLESSPLSVQVGGGVRDIGDVVRLLDRGADRVIVGTRALEEPDWLSEMAFSFPNCVLVAADVKQQEIVSRGWVHKTGQNVFDTIDELNDLPLAGILITAVHREGQLSGPDFDLVKNVTARSKHPVAASGGITTMEDLRALARLGVDSAVIGMALYTSTLDPRPVAEEFGQ